MREEDMPYRKIESEDFFISRSALDEAHSALAGCLAVLGDAANIKLAMEQLCTARGNLGEIYDGHRPNFVVGGFSEKPPEDL